MINFTSAEAARPSRTEGTISGGGATWRTEYVPPKFPQPGEESFPVPQAFSIEQSPGSTSLPHYHDEDQFQVIPAGAGTLGRHDVGGISIHYTNRQTGYGPIVAGKDGLTYFTLRQIATKGIWYLGEGNKPERDAAKRQETAGPIAVKPAAELKSLKAAETEEIIKPHADGLATWLVRVPANVTVASPVHPEGTGRYIMVINGTMQLQGQELTAFTPVFVSHDEKHFNLTAGAGGLEVLVLQYPGGQRVIERKCKPFAAQGPMAKHGSKQAPVAPA